MNDGEGAPVFAGRGAAPGAALTGCGHAACCANMWLAAAAWARARVDSSTPRVELYIAETRLREALAQCPHGGAAPGGLPVGVAA